MTIPDSSSPPEFHASELAQLARDPNTKAADFLICAHSNPVQITQHVPPNWKYGANSPRRRMSLATSTRAGNEVTEDALTPLHLFLGNCCDLTDDFFRKLHKLDGGCLTRATSFGRTPIHWLLKSNRNFDINILIDLYALDAYALFRKDGRRNTPLNLYFIQGGKLGLAEDKIVQLLLRSGSWWGVAAIVNCTAAYRQSASLTGEWRILVTGTPYQIQGFAEKIMQEPTEADMASKLKLLMIIVPIRDPSQYGLSASQGLRLIARVFITVAEVYSSGNHPEFEANKHVWMGAFVDVCLAMIMDDGMLKGMLNDSPHSSAVEALASTEFMSTILHYKFTGGPILVFGFEFALFLALFILSVWQFSARSPDIIALIIGILITAYFTTHSLYKMIWTRAFELKKNHEGDDSDAKERWTDGVKRLEKMRKALRAMEAPRKLEGASSNGSDQLLQSQKANRKKKEIGNIFLIGDGASERIGHFLTVYCFMSAAWRRNAFNVVDFLANIFTLTSLSTLLVYASIVLASGDGSARDLVSERDKMVQVGTACLLSARCIGFLKGTTINFATFIIMLQEIFVDIQTFVVFMFFIVCMFATMYHLLLANNHFDWEDDAAEGWDDWGSAVWKVWGYSLGEVDSGAYPTGDSYWIFATFSLVMIIIMMNILIAIVSDSYSDAIKRSGQLFWRARLDLISEYEPLLPKVENGKLDGDDTDDEDDQVEDQEQLAAKGLAVPKAERSFRVLEWQEGVLATGLICGIVLFELLYIGSLNDEGTFSTRFFWGLGVSAFFLVELSLRVFFWWRCYDHSTRHRVGGFLTNPFRLIDVLLVAGDLIVVIIIVTLAGSSGGSSGQTKATVKLARFVRLARSARWARGAKVLRSCRFIARLMERYRRLAQPTRRSLLSFLVDQFAGLEEKSSWAGRTNDPTEIMKRDLDYSTASVLDRVADACQRIDNVDRDNTTIKVQLEALTEILATKFPDASFEKVPKQTGNSSESSGVSLPSTAAPTESFPKRGASRWAAAKRSQKEGSETVAT